MWATLSRVQVCGWVPCLMAAFSAGIPRASQPMGWRTFAAGHALLAGDDVADRVVPDVAHVDAARGIGVHLEAVELGPGGIVDGGESPPGLPGGLPLALHRGEIVGVGHGREILKRMGFHLRFIPPLSQGTGRLWGIRPATLGVFPTVGRGLSLLARSRLLGTEHSGSPRSGSERWAWEISEKRTSIKRFLRSAPRSPLPAASSGNTPARGGFPSTSPLAPSSCPLLPPMAWNKSR